MNATRTIIVAGGTVLVLAACGGGFTASTPATTPTASASADASVDAVTAEAACGAISALTSQGDSGSRAIATVAGAFNLTQAQVVYVIDRGCPQFKKFLPQAV
jgi:hypothetical protein